MSYRKVLAVYKRTMRTVRSALGTVASRANHRLELIRNLKLPFWVRAHTYTPSLHGQHCLCSALLSGQCAVALHFTDGGDRASTDCVWFYA